MERPRSFRSWIWPPPPIASRLWLAMAVSTAYAAGVWAVHPNEVTVLPAWTTQLAVVNTAILSLLISFRTKVAYDRWWEGRMLWGQLVNNLRNLCLKARELAEPDAVERRMFAALITAFPVALTRHLRGSVQLNEVPNFEKDPATPAHVPAYIAGKVIAVITAWRAADRIDGHAHQILDTHTSTFMDVCGACERIRNTPLPTSYLSLLRHGLVFGFLIAPWAVVETIGLWILPVQAIVVYFMFGIELTAEAVEQPFGADGDDLPLETYCETIRRSAEDILTSS
ncbi:bestrophin family protein [Gemmata sp. SH-PL17]|uniref:bestrophin family protein n=1 Tax=Gemmata sp. SH-PL17 TaxID=1630693 RepID=UPI0028F42AD2|nr:bestrophin family ion channel [Gemmata sp. SH-PL17]